ncbi:phage portal protein [Lacibacterium aquatile]|uniref:Phage portal protein n=1 Tax=Lacibacterium aquatile TaxID=1168082 RepID=A0ABW5DTU4_9PROT
MSLLPRWLGARLKKAAPAPMPLALPLTAALAPHRGGGRRLENPIAHRCLTLIARSVASVPWLLYRDQVEVTRHSALSLLSGGAGARLVESLASLLVIEGEAFVLPNGVGGGAPVELLSIAGFKVTKRGEAIEIGGRSFASSEICHLKRADPMQGPRGRGDLQAAARAIDSHDAALRWNEALLESGARPSLALVYDPKDGPAHLSDEQFMRLKAELKAQVGGAEQAGSLMLLDDGLTVQELSLNPKDMDWLAGRKQAALDIATAFGVPAQLIGIPDAQTYANMEQARLAFWEDTILPLLRLIQDGIGDWLLPQFERGLRFAPDEDAIPALVERRHALFAKLSGASFLTTNERRAAAGYPPLPNGDVL